MKKETVNRVKAATVAMATLNEGDQRQPYTILGTGFCVHSRGMIITCEHVLSAFMDKSVHKYIAETASPGHEGVDHREMDMRTQIPYAIFYRPGASAEKLTIIPSRVDIAMATTDYDLGLVRLHSHAAFPSGYPTLEVQEYAEIYEGMEIATCGFPLGNHLQEQLGTVTSSFTKGILSSVIPCSGAPIEHLKGFQLNLTATHGNSGGPVFSPDTGKVFGVLQRGVSGHDKTIIQGLTKAEPIYPVFKHDSLNRMLDTPVGKIPTVE
jgi:serine protease Do